MVSPLVASPGPLYPVKNTSASTANQQTQALASTETTTTTPSGGTTATPPPATGSDLAIDDNGLSNTTFVQPPNFETQFENNYKQAIISDPQQQIRFMDDRPTGEGAVVGVVDNTGPHGYFAATAAAGDQNNSMAPDAQVDGVVVSNDLNTGGPNQDDVASFEAYVAQGAIKLYDDAANAAQTLVARNGESLAALNYSYGKTSLSMAQDVVTNLNVLSDGSLVVPGNQPSGTTDGAQADTATGTTDGAQADAATGTTDGAQADTATGTTDGAQADAATGTTDGAQADAATGTTDGAQADTATGTTDGAQADSSTGTTDGAQADSSTGTTDGAQADAATGTTDGAQADSSTGTTDGAQADATTGTTDGAQADSTTGTPDSGTAVDSGSTALPNIASIVPPEVTGIDPSTLAPDSDGDGFTFTNARNEILGDNATSLSYLEQVAAAESFVQGVLTNNPDVIAARERWRQTVVSALEDNDTLTFVSVGNNVLLPEQEGLVSEDAQKNLLAIDEAVVMGTANPNGTPLDPSDDTPAAFSTDGADYLMPGGVSMTDVDPRVRFMDSPLRNNVDSLNRAHLIGTSWAAPYGAGLAAAAQGEGLTAEQTVALLDDNSVATDPESAANGIVDVDGVLNGINAAAPAGLTGLTVEA